MSKASIGASLVRTKCAGSCVERFLTKSVDWNHPVDAVATKVARAPPMAPNLRLV
jgi:hypothetical protein